MELRNDDFKKREMPYSHLYHSISPIIFFILGFLDINVFYLSPWLRNIIPLLFRIFFFTIFLCLGLFLIFLSHKILFYKHVPPNRLLTEGVFSYVRHPMYLGILLIYTASIFLFLSILCIIFFCFICIIYNKMANFEEIVLINLFGKVYLDYKKKVSKWIPKIK